MPYFGPWPNWFDFYLQSCGSNGSIDWHFFTDNPEPKNHPKNVRFVKTTLADFNKLASQKLGFATTVKKYIKVCDFRPAFGVIFDDYIKDYDFWGYGDIDTIYGNIRKFFTDDILSRCDIVTTYESFLAGPFTLFKNYRTKYLYRKNPDHEKIFTSQDYLGFDENGPKNGAEWKTDKIFNIKPPTCVKNEGKSISHLVAEMLKRNEISVYAKNLGFCPDRILTSMKLKFENGSLTDLTAKKEILYFHLGSRLTIFNDFLVPENDGRGIFYITPRQIHYGQEISLIEKVRMTVGRLARQKRNLLKNEFLPAADEQIGRFGIWLNDRDPRAYRRLKSEKNIFRGLTLKKHEYRKKFRKNTR
jgi:hypothetical protein